MMDDERNDTKSPGLEISLLDGDRLAQARMARLRVTKVAASEMPRAAGVSPMDYNGWDDV